MSSGTARRFAHRLPMGIHTDRVLDDDIWRATTAYYGAIAWPIAGQPVPTLVFLGARSGLEVAEAVTRSPEARVLVVERNGERRRAVAEVMAGRPHCAVVSNIKEARDWLSGRKVDYLRCDGTAFDLKDVYDVLGGARCGHLCGTYDPGCVDPLMLYRASRDDLASSFFWRDDRSSDYFGGDRGPVDTEVSVVVPAFRVSAEIDQCIGSLAEQTLRKLEVLVVNDGSPDDTGDRARAWAERFPGRVRVIDKPNGGCASARMAGLKEARGEYVGFVDGDDWVAPSMFEELYRAAVLSGAELAQCGYAEVFADGSVRRSEEADSEGASSHFPRTLTDLRHLLTLRPTMWRRIYRCEFLLQHGIEFPLHIPRFDDLPFQFEALALARRMAVVPDAYYFYRQGRPGQDIAVRDDRLFVHFPIFDWLWARVMSWADARIEAQLVRVELNTHLWALCRIEPAFRREYRERAEAQLLDNRVHLTPAQLLRLALPLGRGARRLALGAVMRRAMGWLRGSAAANPPADTRLG